MLTLLMIGPGLAFLIAYAVTFRDAKKGDTAKVLSKLLLVLGIYLLLTGLIASRTPPPSSPYGGPAPYGAPPA